VGTRSRMCYGEWEVWVHGDSVIICYVYINPYPANVENMVSS